MTPLVKTPVPLEKRTDFKDVCGIASALSLVSGMVNVVAFMEIGYLISHMTGNASHMGRLVSSDSLRLLALVGIICAYAVGSFTAGAVNCDGDAVFEGRRSLGLLFCAITVASGSIQQHTTEYLPVTLLLWAYSQGLQNGVTSRFSSGLLRTTHMTGNVTDCGLGLGRVLQAWMNKTEVPSLRRPLFMASLMTSFTLGGLFSFFAHDEFGALTALIPAAVLGFMSLGLPSVLSLVRGSGVDNQVKMAGIVPGGEDLEAGARDRGLPVPQVPPKYDPLVTGDSAVSMWLGISPPSSSPVFDTLQRCFPGAMTGKWCKERIVAMVRPLGLTADSTLYGQSICPDEINNDKGTLASLMQEEWGACFPMGGIGSAPYVGKTGFGAFSAHVPEDGHVLVLFGPHIAISATGELGKVLRVGQEDESGACGAVLAAYNACLGDEARSPTSGDKFDTQQCWLEKKILPYVEDIQAAADPLSELINVAYRAVEQKMMNIVNTKFGSGKLVLVGGIQINMPAPYADQFQPLFFKVMQQGEEPLNLLPQFHLRARASQPDGSKEGWIVEEVFPAFPSSSQSKYNSAGSGGTESTKESSSFINFSVTDEGSLPVFPEVTKQVYSWLNMAPPENSKCTQAVSKNFPGALPGHAVMHRSAVILRSLGLTPENTILGYSVCSDEINHEKNQLTASMSDYWGASFPMGGIGGAPFVGRTGFMAFSKHVPDNGNVFVVFGPHIGVSDAGELGKYLRNGQTRESGACGAVLAAYGACMNDEVTPYDRWDSMDLEQSWIRQEICKRIPEIKASPDPMVKLINVAYNAVKEQLLSIINHKFGSGKLILLGGIQINMPRPYQDQFQPLLFQASSRNMDDIVDLLPQLSPSNHQEVLQLQPHLNINIVPTVCRA